MPDAQPVANDVVAPLKSCVDLYNSMELDRSGFLARARASSKLSLPMLIPPEGHRQTDDLPTPYQSVGARGVNNLASKLLLTMLPTTSSFFRMFPQAKAERELDQNRELKLEVAKALAVYEKTVMREVDRKGDRVVVFEMLKHLIAGGNVLVHDDPKHGLKLFHLDRFCVRRDPNGVPLLIIVKESFDKDSLPQKVRDLIDTFPVGQSDTANGTTTDRPTVDIYTKIVLNDIGTRYNIHQEVSNGLRVPDTEGEFPKDKLPWHALRMIRVAGEDYGRGYVEEYMGDLQSLEGLTRAIVQGSAAASKVLFLVKPNSTTRVETITKAENGAVREGNADDVTVVQMAKFNDFRVAQETSSQLIERLSQAFLLNIRRNAERVTAEEIRFVAEELEQGLGGVFSILTQEFQLPYVKRRIERLVAEGHLPELPKDAVDPIIITGLEALGRGMDREKLIRFVKTATETVGPDAVAAEMNVGLFLERLALADGIDTQDLFKTPEQKAQEKATAENQQMMQTMAGPGAKVLGDAMKANPENLQGTAPDAP